jgi:hypothetical protein
MTNKTKMTEQAYISGVKCVKRLHMEAHSPILAARKEELNSFVEQNFMQVAREIIAPGGLNLNLPGDTDRYYLNRTLRELEKEKKVLYNAAFRTPTGEVSRTDILVKDKSGIHMIEIRMVTEVTDIHLHETSFKYYCLVKVGIVPNKISIVYINKGFILRGNSGITDLKRGFLISRDFTRVIKRVEDRLPKIVERFRKVLDTKSRPDKDIGMYCLEPDPCPFKNHCWEHIPTNSIFDLKEMRITRQLGLYYKGVIDMEQVVEKVGNRLTDVQTVQVASALRQSVVIRREALKEWLDRLMSKSGVYYLDIDTERSPIPLFEGDKPFAVNIVGSRIASCLDGSSELSPEERFKPFPLNHKLQVVIDMVKKCKEDWPIVVYGRTALDKIISQGVENVPELADTLQGLSAKIVDLEEVFREKWYYDPRFKGALALPVITEALFKQNLSGLLGMPMIVKFLMNTNVS